MSEHENPKQQPTRAEKLEILDEAREEAKRLSNVLERLLDHLDPITIHMTVAVLAARGVASQVKDDRELEAALEEFARLFVVLGREAYAARPSVS